MCYYNMGAIHISDARWKISSVTHYIPHFFFFFVFIRECLLCWSEVRDSKLAITGSVFVMSWHKDPLVFQNEWLD